MSSVVQLQTPRRKCARGRYLRLAFALIIWGIAPLAVAEGTLAYFIKSHQPTDPNVHLNIVTFHSVEPDPRRNEANPFDTHREVRVDIEYPVIVGLSDRTTARRINNAIHDWLFGRYQRKALDSADIDVLVDAVIEGQIISIIADKERLSHASMSPETQLEIQHYDLTNGQKIVFSALFHDDYRARLKQILTKGVKGARRQQLELLVANIDDQQAFYIENETLFIYAGEASAEFSPEWLSVKLGDLKGVLSEQHPMVRNAYVKHRWPLEG